MLEQLKPLPLDPILGMSQLYAADNNPSKVSLSVGVYQNTQGNTPILQAVKQAEANLIQQQQTKVYTPQAGDATFIQGMTELLTAQSNVDLQRIELISVPGGCGGLRMASELIKSSKPNTKVWMSNPTWANHKPLISSAGLEFDSYDYYDAATGEVNFEAMMNALEATSAGDTILLHACCHNPTGADLNQQQWIEVLQFCKQNQLFPFIDMAYQGLGHGLEEDAFSINQVLNHCDEAVIVVSCSKNFGLYRERTGALMLLGKDQQQVQAAKSHVLDNARKSYSMSPYHGAGIVGEILTDANLTQQWKDELELMRTTIIESRNLLASSLNERQSQRDYSYLTRNCGMFSYLGFSKEQVVQLREQYGLYMLDSSRINVIGVQPHNIEYIIDSIVNVCH